MKKYLKPTLITLIIIAVLGFIIWSLAKPEDTATTSSTQLTQAEQDLLKTGNTVGNANSKVVVTEFGDYQCPACGAWHPFIKDTILPKYQDKILFAFKNFPLVKAHANAQSSAQAAEAAALQGKFWQMHDKLYENQAEWSELKDPSSKFEQYARDIGLNVDQWKKDRDSNKVKDIIKNDLRLGEKLNLPGTPSFLVNGVLVETKSEADLTNAIDQAIARLQQ